ncbi:hypothetical protein R3P38DRAFT_3266733 [Favolaschia claudopus]|uniref:Uncharacterized protein n=1 Tax=Favolaschia claudopus TaxID=2862362 RepID=A0AAW0BU42_9AGAR
MTLHLKDTILRIGNHIIAPAGANPVPASPAPPPPPPFPTLNPDDLLALAFEIQAKLIQLERLVDLRKALRNKERNSVKDLKKTLASLRDEESKEDEKLAKLKKQHNKRPSVFGSHRDGNRNHNHNNSSYYPSRRTSSALLPVSRGGGNDENPFICATSKAASAFNGNTERYRDTYTFSGPAWTKYPSPIAEAAYDASSPNRPKSKFFDEGVLYTASPQSSADDDDYDTIEANSPMASPTPRGVFADVRNVQMQGNDGRGRKRKSSGEFEEGGSWEKKKMRYEEEYGSATDGSGRRRSRRFSSARH